MENTADYENSGDGEFYDNYDNDYNDYEEPPHSYQLYDENATTVAMETTTAAVTGLFQLSVEDKKVASL